MHRRTLIIDCDPGLDDAVAIALAHSAPEIELTAVTTVAGNAGIETVTRNALGIVAALGGGVPVHRGCGQSLVLPPPRTSAALWGGDGDLHLAARGKPDAEHAVTRLIRHIEASRRSGAAIVAIGPLTNLAVVLTMRPDLRSRIGVIVVMGGGIDHGNATPKAELNIWVDPHAAHSVFASGVPVVLAPLDITEPLRVPPDVVAELAKSKARPAKLVARLMPLAGLESHPASIYDAATIAWLLWPDLFKAKPGRITVDLDPGARLGQTTFKSSTSGAHLLLTAVDQRRFFERFTAQLLDEA
ncbi:MAG: nucleoside hydrolase [Hyphomicrobiaceae bacterium]